jgi:hypothetical protein
MEKEIMDNHPFVHIITSVFGAFISAIPGEKKL